MRVLMMAAGALAALLVSTALFVDEGELVTLLTSENGRNYETQLWIVELDGNEYLRAASPKDHWLARLGVRPEVGLRRSRDREAPVEAIRAVVISDAVLRARIDRAMAMKYGLADKLWGWISDRSRSLPIRIAPRPGRWGEHLEGSSPSAAAKRAAPAGGAVHPSVSVDPS